jgi:membrane protein involved in D-alanine export
MESDKLSFFQMSVDSYWYFLHLYFDFAGYSFMAVGFSNLMGIYVPPNFNKPFLSRNPQQFWRSFHITLGDWLNDYFFKPLYKWISKKKQFKTFPLLRQNFALFSTFTLMGCWNGFQLHFIVSGMLFGLYSVVHNSYIYYSHRKFGYDFIFRSLPDPIVKWVSIVLLFHFAAFSIYIFSGKLF